MKSLSDPSAKKTRVLHVITSLDVGGAERTLSNLASRMDPSNFKNMVINLSGEGPFSKTLNDAGINVINLGMSRGKAFQPLQSLRLLREAFRFRPQIIQTWLYHADLAGTLLSFFLPRSKLVWNIRCSQMDFSRYSPLTRLITQILAAFSRRAALILHNSTDGRLIHENLGYIARQWEYVPNGVDPTVFCPDPKARAEIRTSWGVDEETIVIGSVGRWDPMKGYEYLSAAIEEFLHRHTKDPQLQTKKVKFVLVGRGITHEQPLLAKLPADKVFTLGQQSNIQRILSALDVFVLGSIFGEGFPNVVAEAMSVGLPCIATRVGDSEKILADTGVSVAPGSTEELMHAFVRLVTLPKEELRAMGQRARQRIKERYSMDSMVRQYQDIYIRLSN